jgi:mannose-6-phosphate isomerase-like protein (cupin superfamily)
MATTDIFLLDAPESAGRFSLVRHDFTPKALAAPVHRHRDEDEWSFVLTGQIGALLGDDELVARPGELIRKPRGQWHTFWNAGDEPASVLEIISPGGLEELFKSLAAGLDTIEPEELARMASAYGCDVDFATTMPLMERLGLVL